MSLIVCNRYKDNSSKVKETEKRIERAEKS